MNLHEPMARTVSRLSGETTLVALSGIPLIKPGDDLASVIIDALRASHESLCNGDVLVIAQKIVSKSEGRLISLGSVEPSASAMDLAKEVNKDARLIELILRESTEVVRHTCDVLVVAHKLGFVMANAGIDQSNIEHGDDAALLLPENPDETCARLRSRLHALTGVDLAIIINDSHGRAFRNGTVGVAIGASGLPALTDRRGEADLYGRTLRSTEVALADEIAAAASLLMGQAAESRPVVLAHGVPMQLRDGSAAELIRPKHMDLFRQPSGDAVIRGRRSVRRYTDDVIAESLLERLLSAAVCAPSAHNRQPWRFAIVPDANSKTHLATAMGAQLRVDRQSDGDAGAAIEKDVARSFARITSAPTLVLTCLTMEEMDHYPDPRRNEAERTMAVQGTAMATQNLLLAAHTAGLAASVMCAPLFCPNIVRAALDLPADWEPQALVTLGYPANGGKPLLRKPLASVIRVVRAVP
jgi:coenzyme F420-0:L-glutamate ligase/coenzyme F420-1:gamma-L-glutamate ligase